MELGLMMRMLRGSVIVIAVCSRPPCCQRGRLAGIGGPGKWFRCRRLFVTLRRQKIVAHHQDESGVSMLYRILGRTGLKVSQLGFGAMRLPMVGEGEKAAVNRELSTPMIHRAIELGVNYFDTAVGYCNG